MEVERIAVLDRVIVIVVVTDCVADDGACVAVAMGDAVRTSDRELVRDGECV